MPRTVLYIAWAPFFAGAERALLLLLQALDRSRYVPHVIVGTDGELRAQLRDAGIPSTYIPISYTDGNHPTAWLRCVWQMARVARSVEAAVIHGNNVPGFQPAGHVAKLLARPAVVHVRGALGPHAYEWFLKSGFVRALFVSRGLMDLAVNVCPNFFEGRSEVLYDGVQLPSLPSTDERQAKREALGLAPDRPAVVLAGQVAEVKGVWEYVEAARILVDGGVNATFVVLGDDLRGNGETRRRMEARVAELGLQESFRFLGFRPNAPELMPLFDVVAVPSHVEPLGNATLEGMAAGRPVVGSRVGGIPEMIADRETGFLIPARDSHALAEGLRQLLVDPTLRERMGAEGRRRAGSLFSVAEHAQRVQAVYDQVLGNAVVGRFRRSKVARRTDPAHTPQGRTGSVWS